MEKKANFFLNVASMIEKIYKQRIVLKREKLQQLK